MAAFEALTRLCSDMLMWWRVASEKHRMLLGTDEFWFDVATPSQMQGAIDYVMSHKEVVHKMYDPGTAENDDVRKKWQHPFGTYETEPDALPKFKVGPKLHHA